MNWFLFWEFEPSRAATAAPATIRRAHWPRTKCGISPTRHSHCRGLHFLFLVRPAGPSSPKNLPQEGFFCLRQTDYEGTKNFGYAKPEMKWWRGLDSNQRTHSGQIYSLVDLTTLPPLHRVSLPRQG